MEAGSLTIAVRPPLSTPWSRAYGLGVHPYFDLPTPHLFAHRGASGEAPPNTMPAFERAVALGIPYLETDCHATRDGELVLCHDETVDASTDGSGEISSYRFADLMQLDAGHQFSSDGKTFPFRGQGIRIPRLAELLERFPEARVNLEIKPGGRAVVESVIQVIRDADASSRVLLAAADDAVMEQIRKLDPGTAVGSSTGEVVAFFRAIQEDRVAEFEPSGHALQIPTEFAGNPLITPECLAAARHHGVFVHVWTINDRAEMRLLLEAGVDGIMSDLPGLLLEESRAFAAAR